MERQKGWAAGFPQLAFVYRSPAEMERQKVVWAAGGGRRPAAATRGGKSPGHRPTIRDRRRPSQVDLSPMPVTSVLCRTARRC